MFLGHSNCPAEVGKSHGLEARRSPTLSLNFRGLLKIKVFGGVCDAHG
jgi:hypothetical protein